jgi:hypothetical protein
MLLSCAFISAKAHTLDPSDVLKQDGILRISDGSSYYEFNTNGTFWSFPIGMSGRCFAGTWTSNADPNSLHFTVKAKRSWKNGIVTPPGDWKIVFTVYLATFDCYWIIEELANISKPDK